MPAWSGTEAALIKFGGNAAQRGGGAHHRRMHWIYLLLAIVAEVVATSALRASAGLSRWRPLLLVVPGYALSFYCLAQTLERLPLGLVYAIWSGVGIALLALIGWLLWGQVLDAAALLGIALILAGVGVIQLGSRNMPH